MLFHKSWTILTWGVGCSEITLNLFWDIVLSKLIHFVVLIIILCYLWVYDCSVIDVQMEFSYSKKCNIFFLFLKYLLVTGTNKWLSLVNKYQRQAQTGTVSSKQIPATGPNKRLSLVTNTSDGHLPVTSNLLPVTGVLPVTDRPFEPVTGRLFCSSATPSPLRISGSSRAK
jgi:hypothetical protein